MRLSDYITQEEKITLAAYLEAYHGIEKVNVDRFLTEWNKQKRTLFKALGKQLRVIVPFTVELDEVQYRRNLSEIYTPLTASAIYAGSSSSDEYQHPFMLSLKKRILQLYDNNVIADVYMFVREVLRYLFNYRTIRAGICMKDIILDEGEAYWCTIPLKIPKGTKIMRAIRKLLVAIDFNDWDSFEDWRNDISDLNTSVTTKMNLVLSIHPLDMMTLSDNNCGWSSCYNLATSGCYSDTLTAFLNSNCCMVAYLQSKRPFYFDGDYEIPNKSWRSLVICHKDILLVDKPYPYTHTVAAKKILEVMRELVKKNLQWEYQYGPQLYRDTWGIDQERPDIVLGGGIFKGIKDKPHAIGLKTNYIYNDLIADTDTEYWCCRNFVKKSKIISISGPLTCIYCGEKIKGRGHHGICDSCYDNTCKTCGLLKEKEALYLVPICFSGSKTQSKIICEECLFIDFWYIPEKQFFVVKDYVDKDKVSDSACKVERHHIEQYRIR